VFASYCLRNFEFGGEEARSEEYFVRVILFEWRSKASSKCDVMEDDDWVTGPLTERFRVAFRPTSEKERKAELGTFGRNQLIGDRRQQMTCDVCLSLLLALPDGDIAIHI
jgi:hypothetical protein